MAEMMQLDFCPFCGGDPVLSYRGGTSGVFGWVECSTCGCRTKAKRLYTLEINGEQSPLFWSQQAFVELSAIWNRRVNNGREENVHQEGDGR